MVAQSRTKTFEAVAQAVLARRRVPRATYRVQFNRTFTFADARRLVPYFEALGISDIYASPFLKASPGSLHGYDVCDHRQLNPEIGADEDLAELSAELHRAGMGQILDVVPNHMRITPGGNEWWHDVLENGPSSPYATFFDIDWQPLKVEADLENRVLLPILGGPYGRVLENQEIELCYADGAFYLQYYDHRLPIAPDTYVSILRACGERLGDAPSSDDEHLLEFQSIVTALNHLPSRTETDLERIAERQREKEVAKRRLAAVCDACPAIHAAVAATVVEYNGRRGNPPSFDQLDALLNEQSYRLAFWRVATEEINYRRFFDVNHLAAIRMERPDVFEEAHRLVLRLLCGGKVTGLRIDHPDGLWDPAGYLRDLQRSYFLAVAESVAHDGSAKGSARESTNGVARTDADRWLDSLAQEFAKLQTSDPSAPLVRPLYVVVEKILGHRESLSAHWPVDGTTGYEFANAVNGLFVDTAASKSFDDIYAGFIRTQTHFPNLVNSTKKMIMLISLASEINELAYQIKRIARKNRWYRDFSLNSLTFAIREVIAALPVYRTYLVGTSPTIEPQDRLAVETAIAEAKRRNPRTAAALFDFVRDVLLLNYPDNLREDEKAAWANFVMHLQQTTGPVMAKSLEDTAFYIYNRLVSLNEVGGNPNEFGTSPAAFHRQSAERLRQWPHSLLATSTHDSKRSEDVRARIDVLSEVPRLWRSVLTRWSRINRSKKTLVDGEPAPSRNDEYLLYQTLLGAWPLGEPTEREFDDFRDRIKAYMQKATREAKVHTSWINQNTAYETAVERFVEALLDRRASGSFLSEFKPFQELIAYHGAFNSLSQTLIKATAPGVPDCYQGTELWSFNLVDPDNRRPVDFGLRVRLLDELLRRTRGPAPDLLGLARELLATWQDGRIKLYVLALSLGYRREHPDLFASGQYIPIEAQGSRREHAFAFARTSGKEQAIIVVPRLVARLTGTAGAPPLGPDVWQGTALTLPSALDGTSYRNVFTGERIDVAPREDGGGLPLSEVFASFPVALLEPFAACASAVIRADNQ